MAEQAHFAKYKISLKNNNKESQQVNENIRVRNSKIQNIDYSIIREVESSGVDKWKKGGEIFEISPSFFVYPPPRILESSNFRRIEFSNCAPLMSSLTCCLVDLLTC